MAATGADYENGGNGENRDAGLAQEGRVFSTVEEVLRKLVSVEGLTLRAIDQHRRAASAGAAGNKGIVGQIIEESVLGYNLNSDPEPDIIADGESYELKVTPLRHLAKGKGTSAKERLVVDIINYMKITGEEFDSSLFWEKARNIILVYYYDDRTDRKTQSILDCRIERCVMLRYSDEDLRIIRNDWQTIHDKITAGHADMLSESDTDYVGACTKGANSTTMRDAPAPAGSPVPTIRAKQRAFSLKSSYMTAVIRRLLADGDSGERLALSPSQTLETYVADHFAPYTGMTIDEIARRLAIPTTAGNGRTAKNINSSILLRILGVKGGNAALGDIEQFEKANVTQAKTVVIYGDGMPREHMSFPAFTKEQWEELANPSIVWEDSFIHDFFEENKFLLTVFNGAMLDGKPDRMNATLTGGFLWNMPETDIESYVRPVWERLHDTLVAGRSFHYHDKTLKSLPGPRFNNVFHIRPHARDGEDTIELPNGDVIPKQSFWLDRHYLAQVVVAIR